MKTQVLDVIGETELKRSAAVNAALEANDRLKYCFSLLQMAAARADRPDQPAITLRRERLNCGIDDLSFDEMVGAATRDGECYKLAGWAKLRDRITQDVRVMAAPVAAQFSSRADGLLAALPQDEILGVGAIATITSAQRGKSDSLHRLVMDLHKAINAMQPRSVARTAGWRSGI